MRLVDRICSAPHLAPGLGDHADLDAVMRPPQHAAAVAVNPRGQLEASAYGDHSAHLRGASYSESSLPLEAISSRSSERRGGMKWIGYNKLRKLN